MLKYRLPSTVREYYQLTRRYVNQHSSLSLDEEEIFSKYLLVSQDLLEGVSEGITFINWRSFLSRLGFNAFKQKKKNVGNPLS